MTDLERLADIVERGSIKEVRSCVRKLLDSGVTPEEAFRSLSETSVPITRASLVVRHYGYW